MEMLAMMEKEFTSSISDISHKAEMLQISTKEKQAGAIEESREQLEEAEDLLKQMELEIVSMNPSAKATYQQRIKKYKDDLEEAKIKVEKMEHQHKFRIDKETAMGGYA
jgi:vesicle transport through interaction with t-SNAREs 1